MASGVTFAIRETLVAAIECGDILALEAFFMDARVRAEVAETELFILEHQPTTPAFRRPFGAETPWYCLARSHDSHFWKQDVFSVAVVTDQLELLQWFFSPPRLTVMRATLALLWPSMAMSAVETDNGELLEYLLNVAAAELFPDERNAAMVSSVLSSANSPSPDMVKILLAYGGQIDAEAVLRHYSRAADPHTIDVVIQNGAFIVGANVLYESAAQGRKEIVEQFIQHGADSWSASGALVIAAVRRHFEIVDVLVEKGFVDVNARCEFGMTALIGLSGLDPATLSGCSDRQLTTAKMLLEAGAEVAYEGMSALHYAVQRQNVKLVELLLRYGANPNGADNIRGTVTAWVDVQKIGASEAVAHTLELLLCNGADPFADSKVGGSVLERLMKYEAGRAFIAAHPEYF